MMAPRRERSGSGSFVETVRRRASLDSEVERPSPLAFVRKGSAGANATRVGDLIPGGGGRNGAAAAGNNPRPQPPPPKRPPPTRERRPTVAGTGLAGLGRRPTLASTLSRRLSHETQTTAGEFTFFDRLLFPPPLIISPVSSHHELNCNGN